MRSQVPALVGIVVWLLLIENLIVGDIAGVGSIGRYLPGAAAKALTGQDPTHLLSPGPALAMLTVYAAAATAVGIATTERRDFA